MCRHTWRYRDEWQLHSHGVSSSSSIGESVSEQESKDAQHPRASSTHTGCGLPCYRVCTTAINLYPPTLSHNLAANHACMILNLTLGGQQDTLTTLTPYTIEPPTAARGVPWMWIPMYTGNKSASPRRQLFFQRRASVRYAFTSRKRHEQACLCACYVRSRGWCLCGELERAFHWFLLHNSSIPLSLAHGFSAGCAHFCPLQVARVGC